MIAVALLPDRALFALATKYARSEDCELFAEIGRRNAWHGFGRFLVGRS